MEKKSGNNNLKKANKAKKDEFYTQLSDIERELGHYKEYFTDKVIFCNCDDPEESNFFKYFALNFEYLGLKKLIATHFETEKSSYKLEITRGLDLNNDGKIDLQDTKKIKLKQNGDFRSPECIEILESCDIVVTNPPFSLFRDYVAQLFEYDKKFITIGHQNAITYKEIFKLIKENKIWLGYGFKGGAGHFINTHYEDYATAGNHKEGMIRVSGVNWFTNLEINKRHEDLILYKTYNVEEYPKYDNYDAINVDITKSIPMDYKGAMGVPITFMDKYNPDQFEILGLGNSRDNFSPNKNYENPKKIMKDGSEKNGNAINCVLVLEVNIKPVDKIYYISDNSKNLIAPYARILIKNKKL
ncbi:MAG: adenine-specific methyltransferase EcoRI family protein [Candidatus Gracilibacteria bacterium]|nr:adenine-specific methyltransferase EcoRI family protein [Candidatus Gracilibacteria bacterium]